MRTSARWIVASILLIVIVMTAACSAAPAAPKTFTIGILTPGFAFDVNVEGFKDGMTELGYIEGQNVTYIFDGPIEDEEAQIAYAASLEEQKVDVIFVSSTGGLRSAQAGAKNTPIVFAPVAYPVAAELIDSLSKPGHNTTGVSNGGSHGPRLQWLLKVAPEIKRVYIPMQPGATSSELTLLEVQAAADDLGLTLVIGDMTNDAEVDQAIADFPDDVDAIFMIPGPFVGDTLPRWLEVSLEHKIPLSPEVSVENGGLVTYIADDYNVGYQAARLVDQILDGASAGDLPVETAEFTLGINLKTADELGLTIPDSILGQAKTIIR
jgi:putative ABC transport system substrate-binding protein